MIDFKDWMPVWKTSVLANTGCQLRFLPLMVLDSQDAADVIKDIVRTKGVWDEIESFETRHNALWEDEGIKGQVDEIEQYALYRQWQPFVEGCTFARQRLTIKMFRPQGSPLSKKILGIELAIETTSPGDHFNDRGFLLNTIGVPEAQKHAGQFGSVYPQVQDDTDYVPDGGKTLGVVLHGDDGSEYFRINIVIHFKDRTVQEGALGAHVVIDIGNTRTGALLLKDDLNSEGFDGTDMIARIRGRCKPVLLNLPTKTQAVTKDDLKNVDNGIVGSWIMLHETEFNERTPSVLQRRYLKKTVKRWFGLKTDIFNNQVEERMPTMFVRYSPVIFGQEAEAFLGNPKVMSMINSNLQVQQSSPKRYFAVSRKQKADWSMIPNDLDEINPTNASKLCSNLLYWMNERGDFVDPDRTDPCFRPIHNPSHPNYPRSSTFVWMLVGILERAWDQCNRLTESGTFYPYEIQNVVITFPSGWTRDERLLYREKCEEAVRIFERTNFSTDGRIKLHMDVDEAVASQLPFVFSEITKFKNNVNGWLSFAGRERQGRPTFRIMNFDVGGGTTDISVVEYEQVKTSDDELVDLQPRLLFRDGYSEAGDELLRRIIEQVVFPAIEKANPEWGQKISQYFTGQPEDDPTAAQRSKDLKLCVIPLAIRIMTELSGTLSAHGFSWSAAGVDPESCNALYLHMGLPLTQQGEVPPEWQTLCVIYNADEVNALIRKFFTNGFENAARIAAQYDIDMFFMSGKTSELPEMSELAREHIPVTNDRIMTAKNYRAGPWYPFVKVNGNASKTEETIRDAKSITAVGAALNFMLRRGEIGGWRIEDTIFDTGTTSVWGLQKAFESLDGKTFAFDANEEATVYLDTRMIIARQMTKNAYSSPVYRLQHRDPDAPFSSQRYKAVIRRCTDESTRAEYLEIVSLTRDGDNREYKDEFVLGVCQGDGLFWQDNGSVIFE